MASRFTVRVLLQDEDDYTDLHKYMAAEGFTKFIESAEGQQYDLPPAEYNLLGERTPGDVLAMAKRAARRTGKKHQILVSPCEPRVWSGLDEATDFEQLLEAIYKH